MTGKFTTKKLLNEIVAMCEFDYKARFHTMAQWQKQYAPELRSMNINTDDWIAKIITMPNDEGELQSFYVQVSEVQ